MYRENAMSKKFFLSALVCRQECAMFNPVTVSATTTTTTCAPQRAPSNAARFFAELTRMLSQLAVLRS